MNNTPSASEERIRISDKRAIRKARVAVTYKRPTRAELSAGHKARLRSKLSRRQQGVGFQPVLNKRISAAFANYTIDFLEKGLPPHLAHNEANRMVAKQLPVARASRGAPKPSKSDDAAYRAGGNFNKATGRQMKAAA